MNISLSGAGKKKKSSLGFGLNQRSTAKKSGGSSKNVFGDDSDEDEEEDHNPQEPSGRQAVNQEIAKEQAALRQRAEAALATAEDPSMYDYDGAYDSFKPDPQKAKASDGNTERKSKYIGDLLKAAKVRERERDAIYERKIAREQAKEDGQEEFAGKEKFVTKAYKRKLEERKQWEMEQEEKQREEEENDVTRKSAGAAFAGFYGNLNKNVAVGGQGEQAPEDDKAEKVPPKDKGMETLDDFDPRGGFMSGFEHSKVDSNEEAERDESNDSPDEPPPSPKASPQPMLTIREIREKKVAEARIRYLKRMEAASMNQ